MVDDRGIRGWKVKNSQEEVVIEGVEFGRSLSRNLD